jgi:hypothetical protein
MNVIVSSGGYDRDKLGQYIVMSPNNNAIAVAALGGTLDFFICL